MANIKTWLLEYEKEFGEPIEAIVVGTDESLGWGAPTLPDENIVLSREYGLAKVDKEYDNGYGGADCHPITAWTKSRVIYIHEYDGSTYPSWFFRNPTPHKPSFS